jgi:FlaA1/EpsC-like NDP-sugar epimerase
MSHIPLQVQSSQGFRTTTAARWLRLVAVAQGHLALFVAIYWVAFLLRFDFNVPAVDGGIFLATLPWVLVIKFAAFLITRQFQGWSRHVTFADLASLGCAALCSLLCLTAINQFVFISFHFIPRVVLLLDFAGTILCLGALRSSWRFLQEHAWPVFRRSRRSRALLIGAEQADKIFAQRLQTYANFPFQICGFLDRDWAHRGKRIGGIPILGSTADLADAARHQRATDVIVISGSLAGKELREVMEHCETAGLNLKIIPPLSQLLNGDNQIPLKTIEITDLLRREPVQLDTAAVKRLFEGTTVFVTGAGGSIGSEICRQLLGFPLETLVLIERAEGSLFTIDLELRSLKPSCRVVPALGDVTDADRMRKLFDAHRPDILLHVAAHKHVPMLEDHPSEAVKNNVFGSALMADLAHEFDVGHFVYISTDKAVNPSSIMGVSKHIAEDYVHAMSSISDTRFVAVRFGNVLGSAGSVVPLFQNQIRSGGPITITHPDMTRFFMAIPEASQLVLQAAAMGRGGEIFVLDMGEPVRIVDLARDLIRLSGLPPHAMEIVFSGVRPGEKLYEELYFADERELPTGHPKLHSALHRPIDLAELRESLHDLKELVDGDDGPLLEKLKEMVPEYVDPAEAESNNDSNLTVAQVNGNGHSHVPPLTSAANHGKRK